MAMQQFSTSLAAYRTWHKQKQLDTPEQIQLELGGRQLRAQNKKEATWKQIMEQDSRLRERKG